MIVVEIFSIVNFDNINDISKFSNFSSQIFELVLFIIIKYYFDFNFKFLFFEVGFYHHYSKILDSGRAANAEASSYVYFKDFRKS